jgi:peptidoglycan/xylan/chitin deacetylase (PgdA/CDA1 family)
MAQDGQPAEQNPLTIVMYHYIRDFKRSRYPHIRGLEKDGFLRQLDYLQASHTIVRMADVVDAAQANERLPENAALLTFDDAYAEHYAIVFPHLFDRGLEGSFFAPVEPVRDSKLLDVNRIHFILAASIDDPSRISAMLDSEVRAAKQEWQLETVEHYRATWAKPNRFDDAETIYIKRMLQTALPEALRNAIAQRLFAHFVAMDEAAFAAELYLTEPQAKLMQANGMYFGSHGASHYWLNQIPEAMQQNEIDRSLSFLRDIGSPVDDHWVMCYPYGGWNDSLLSVLKSRNCTLGLTTEVATADLARHNPLTLPRYDTNDFPQ